MDDRFVLWPKNVDIDVFREVLNELHPPLQFKVVISKTLNLRIFTSIKLLKCFY